ncbi:hypothetical protein [Agrobacterium sp. Azo12]|uniref:hypothetical protein n=1 Tax=Agrobacterium sp. Azo12 TaxID=3031129 RepID=UPI0023D8C467|nr:hypothetical protein [Agrobacterium sp. Azo12]MDO5895125.1 hypothetical protein [Agrobacterium sp. Azo12]
MADILVWPKDLLTPLTCEPRVIPFSRSGGRSLGGFDPAVRTDRGFWSIELSDVPVSSVAQRRTWLAIRTALGGRSGLIAVPAWSQDVAPYASGMFEEPVFVPHDDDTPFSDGSLYRQGAIAVQSVGETAIGATVIKLRVINAEDNLVGVRFSYQHALYETGPAIDVDGDVWTVPLSTTIRATIPDGADLEFDNPTCLCHLASDDQMGALVDPVPFERRSVSFIEANDYWNQLALGLI